MPIFQASSLNTTALIVPDLYVQVLAPNVTLINGVPTNVIGAVGAATWGPVNQPVNVGGGNMTQFASFFGQIMNRKYDLGTFVALAVLQGAQAFIIVRVTDGTDTAATASIITPSDLTQLITVAGTPKAGDVLTLAVVQANPGVTIAAALAWTAATPTIIMAAINTGTVVPGMTVYDTTNGFEIGTVLSYVGVTLTLTANALHLGSAADSLVFGGNTISAGASWLTSSPNITMGISNPGWVVPGMNVYDSTKNVQIGTVLTYAGTALVLTANALSTSTGTTDVLVFGATVASYQMQAADTTQTGALGLAANVNANAALQTFGISADTPISGVFKLHYPAAPNVVVGSVGGVGATDTVTVAAAGTTASVLAITINSIYTGSNGNNEAVTIYPGSAVGTWKLVVSLPGYVPETFDNIGVNPGGSNLPPLKGNFVWQAMASAVNNGVSGIRGKSALVTAPTVGTSGATPVATTAVPTVLALTGGTDGYTGITTATMIGADVSPRTGMYALRNQTCSIGALVDVFDQASWSTQVSFGIFEGIYFAIPGQPSDTLSNATGPAGTKAAAGIDSYAVKMCFGDWIFWFDPVNNLQRLVSPQGPYCGLLSNLAPQNSTLNKQIFGIIGTQKSATGLTYSDQSDLAALSTSGWDVIANPIPAGNMFGSRMGRNASSNAVIHGDNYSRMTNYIAATLNRSMGIFVGQLQSRRPTDKTRAAAKATADAYFQALLDQGMIDDFQNICDLTNNPVPRIALGFMQLDCQVVYLAVVEYFIVNLMGGQSVVINKLSTQPTSTFTASPNSSLISAA